MWGRKKKPEKEEFDNLDDTQENLEDMDGLRDDFSIEVSKRDLKMTQEAIEWENCITRMEKHCMKSWICIPHIEETEGKARLFLEVHEVDKCTSDTFFKWLNTVWPPCRDMKHSPSDYDKGTYRYNAITNVVGFHQLLQFPSNKKQ